MSHCDEVGLANLTPTRQVLAQAVMSPDVA